MDRDEVLAIRESVRIAEFLDLLVEAHELTEFERAVVREEGDEVFRHAGYMGDRTDAMGAEASAVIKHSNHAEKQRLLALRPGLADRLTEFIERRPYHPVPPVPAELRAPGVALKQYRTFLRFIDEKLGDATLTQDHAHEVYKQILRMFDDAGVDYALLNDRTDPALIAHALNLMKARLLELHPELASQVEKLGESRRSR